MTLDCLQCGEAYQYDGLHRLSNYQSGTVSGNTVPTPVAYQDWTLSKLGNWTAWDNDGTNETRTHNNINALTARSAVANPLTYDVNFNQTDDGDKYTYEYDANDRLKIVRNRTTTAVVAEYRYDVFGRRIEKEVGSDITRYYHAGQQIIEERDGSDAVVATYTYGDYIDEPLTMDRSSERYYYHTNRMYSVYALTDSAGDLIERYSYTPYGVTTTYDDAYANSQTTSRVGNPFTFTGRELDAETLLMYYRARIYDPVTGRFNQLDPIGFAGGDLNLYAYVRNRPTVLIDPSGYVPAAIPLVAPAVPVISAKAVATAAAITAATVATAEAIRRLNNCRCKVRNPDWNGCPLIKYSSADGVHRSSTKTIQGYETIHGRCILTNKANNCGTAGGEWYQCILQFKYSLPTGRPAIIERRRSVSCCNCCEIFHESKSCKINHPESPSGGEKWPEPLGPVAPNLIESPLLFPVGIY